MSKNKKRILRALICFACVVTLASGNTLLYAAPSTSELEGTTSQLQGELDSLNSELASLSSELDAASAQIETLSAEVEKAKLDLAAAQLNEDAQYEAMKDRIKFMYEGGNVSLLQTLFTSEDMSDFLNKAEYVAVISEYDRNMLNELKQIRSDVEQKQADLQAQQDELASLQEDLTQRQNALSAKISSTSSDLANYSAQLERAKAAEAALAAAQDNSVSGTVSTEGQAGSSGGSVSTGTSVPADTSDVALFAALLQCEAGGSNYDGMLAVATVVMNRVTNSRYPSSIRGVIYQRGQFSPTWNGSLNRVLAQGATSTAYSVAQAAIGGARHSAVIGCYSFNAAYTGKPGTVVGGNVFW